MQNKNRIAFGVEGIGHMLSDRYLVVPKYQRSYAWETYHVEDLFLDISTAIDSRDPEYFLGSIVLSGNKDAHWEVVDGQQRLATVCILLASIRDKYLEIGDNKRADIIERQYLFDDDFDTGDPRPKLTLNANDHDFFLQIIKFRGSSDWAIKETRKSHERISTARQVLSSRVSSILTNTRDPGRVLAKWKSYIESSATVIRVEVPDHANAFTIFETLNDRGADLSLADLLKNYLYGASGGRLEEVQSEWGAMLGAIDDTRGEKRVVEFIRE